VTHILAGRKRQDERNRGAKGRQWHEKKMMMTAISAIVATAPLFTFLCGISISLQFTISLQFSWTQSPFCVMTI